MIRQIDDELYQIVCGWWEKHGWPVIPKNMLGNDGYMIFIGEKPIMSAYLYKAENASYGMIEWVLSNPESTHEERTQVFDLLMDHLAVLAKDKKIACVQMFAKNKRLEDRLVKSGFSKSGEGLSGYFKITI